MRVEKHTTHDWCHICGTRSLLSCDVWYPENAENIEDNKDKKYIRICFTCITRMKRAIAGEKQ